mgnify:CR=1 FL=1
MKPNVLVLAVIFVFLSVCQTIHGSAFTPAADIPAGKALVYVYKPLAYGKSLYMVYINREPLVKLRKGGYYPYYATPGELEIIADKKARLGELLEVFNIEPNKRMVLQVEPGKVYYVKLSGSLNVKFSQVDESEALTDLAKCKELPAYKKPGK